MDMIWALRSAYNQAMKLKVSQDEYCSKAESGLWESLDGPFPDDFRWEMLVDVLRGKVKVGTHLTSRKLPWFSNCSCRFQATAMKPSILMPWFE